MSGSNESERSKLVSYLEKLGKINQWVGLMAADNLGQSMEDRQRAIRAEENWGAKALGQKPIHPEEDEEMGDRVSVLGDYTVHPAPVVKRPRRSMLGPILATAGLCLGIPGAGAIGYYLASRGEQDGQNKQETPIVDETLRVGLGRPDDLIE